MNIYLRVEILDAFKFCFVDTFKQFSKMMVPFHCPMCSIDKSSGYSTFAPTLGVFLSFSSYLVLCASEVSQYGFNFHFPKD